MNMRRSILIFLTLSGSAFAGSLSGTLVIAADGIFLGQCAGLYDSSSISNDYSPYGSKYAVKSMFNEYGLYGGKYAVNSPFNAYGQPAYLVVGNSNLKSLFISPNYRSTPAVLSALRASGAARISINTNYPNAIDPNALRIACQNP